MKTNYLWEAQLSTTV